MTAAKDRSLAKLTECGCCEGREVAVPAEIHNRAGLKAIAYRIGTREQFKKSLLARLSTTSFPALQQLTTREDDDFTIALLDAWATVADVLTFYQERIANEGYLRTATEKLSIRELARLTGYALSPGVAATAYLAFTLEEAPSTTSPGASATSSTSLAVAAALRQAEAMVPESVTIAAGTKVQSVPGQDEEAQVFETVEAISARPAWNKMRPELTRQQTISAKQSSSILVEGISLQLKRGDRLLLISGSDKALRQIDEVEEDASAKTTTIKLITGTAALSLGGMVTAIVSGVLSPPPASPKLAGTFEIAQAASGLAFAAIPVGVFTILQQQQVFVMRARASLFGHNAPAWNLLTAKAQSSYGSPSDKDWPFKSTSRADLDLDAVYSQIVPDSWVVVAPDGDPDKATFAEVEAVRDTGASGYGLSSKVTRIRLSQAITISSMADLRKLVVYGQSEELTLAGLPREDPVEKSRIELEEDVEGLEAGQSLIVSGEVSDSSGAYASELVTVQSASVANARTVLSLRSGLTRKYERDTVTINGNVALATHGETVSETLGSGDAGEAFQSFKLKQKPLTYLTDSSPSGAASTLKLSVNDVLWTEVDNLLDSGPQDHHYVVFIDVDGTTRVRFGDGTNGARLPTGQNNVTATYRKGSGLDGRVKKDQLSLLLTRSYGLKEVANPIDADGGDDPESAALARSNAPVKVRTLGRVVSLRDYEDFARAFSGIAKASARWAWFGDRKGVFLTVAPSPSKTSSSTSSGSTLLKSLGDALRKAGSPFVRFQIKSYRPVTFRLSLRVKILPAYKKDTVKTAVEKALRDAFSFSKRSFEQPVYLSEVMGVAQGVAGVGGVDVDKLYRSGTEAKVNDRLVAAGPEVGSDGSRVGAELLTLYSGSLDDLGVMS